MVVGTLLVPPYGLSTPLQIDMNFRRFKNVQLLKVKELTFNVSAEEEKDALELGPIYVRAPLLEKLFEH